MHTAATNSIMLLLLFVQKSMSAIHVSKINNNNNITGKFIQRKQTTVCRTMYSVVVVAPPHGTSSWPRWRV